MSPVFKQYSPNLWIKQNEPFATNTGIFLSEEQAFLIDPGISQVDCAHIRDFLCQQNLQPVNIFLTHAHWDHVLGAQFFPETCVITHKNYQEVIREYSQHLFMQAAEWITSTSNCCSTWEPPAPHIVFTDNMEFVVGRIPIRIKYGPGHTDDHSLAYMPKGNILWAGDMLSDLELPLVNDILAYRRTLMDIQKLDIDIIVPGHGTPAIESTDIAARFDQDGHYVRTLHQCVHQALSCGYDLQRTIKTCLDVSFTQPDTYPNAHVWNIESAYAKLGGTFEGVIGWDKEWPTIAKS